MNSVQRISLLIQASYFVANPAPQPAQVPQPPQGFSATPVHAKTQ